MHPSRRTDSNVVRLYYSLPDEAATLGLLAEYGRIMSPDEHQRETRFTFARHRLHFRVTRALVRSVLAPFAAAAPADLKFRVDERGKPHCVGPAAPRLEFSVSHADGLVACAVRVGGAVGLDVERLGHKAPLDVAERYFARNEIADLERLGGDGRNRRFYEYWTLKEAYIKARGMGMALSLNAFGFEIRPERIAITFDPAVDDDPRFWRFMLVPLAPSHLSAVSVHVDERDTSPVLEVWRVVPLRANPVHVASARLMP